MVISSGLGSKLGSQDKSKEDVIKREKELQSIDELLENVSKELTLNDLDGGDDTTGGGDTIGINSFNNNNNINNGSEYEKALGHRNDISTGHIKQALFQLGKIHDLDVDVKDDIIKCLRHVLNEIYGNSNSSFAKEANSKLDELKNKEYSKK